MPAPARRNSAAGLRAIALLMALAALSPPLSAQPLSLRSQDGRFRLRVDGIERPEHLNHLHGLDLVLTAADGAPATGATIVLTGQRRYSTSPLPTLPQVIAAGADGAYRVEGLRFHIAGEWHLVFDIDFKQNRDRVGLDVLVK
jgi:hypothetical protein